MADDLEELLRTWGIPSRAAIEVSSPQEWLDAANGRPAWALWGKAMPASACPAHPLLCHMVDVAAVAALLLTARVAPALRARLLHIWPDESTSLRALLLI